MQLLIRKKLFDKIGLFLTDQGSIADFEWGMRASLAANIFHVPEHLASWRIHPLQATADSIQTDPETYHQLRCLIDHAFHTLIEKKILKRKFYKKSLKDIYWKNEYDLAMKKATGKGSVRKIFFRYFFNDPILILKLISLRVIYRNRYDNLVFIRSKIKSLGLEGNIKIV